MVAKVVRPLPRATWVRCGEKTDLAKPIDVLFALCDEHRCVRLREKIWEAVNDAPNAVEAPFPSSLAVGSALNELLA